MHSAKTNLKSHSITIISISSKKIKK